MDDVESLSHRYKEPAHEHNRALTSSTIIHGAPKFFDLVCHQRLTARLAQRVGDRRLLVLIGRMLKAKVVPPDGVVISSEQGVPQGGPSVRLALTRSPARSLRT